MCLKGNVTSPNGEVPYGLLSKSCIYCPNLISAAILQLDIKRFVKITWLWGNDVTNSWSKIPNGTLWMRFTCFPNLMFLTTPWLEMYKSSNWSFCWLWAIQNWVILLALGSRYWPYLFLLLWAGHSYFNDFGQETRP